MVAPPLWQLHTSIDAVIFDCDGTLSSIEGIDELAKINNIGDEVKKMTADAMGSTGLNPALYQKRLDLVRPTQTQVNALSDLYLQHQSTDALALIDILKRLNKSVYVISAGLYPAVLLFSEKMGIPRENVFAVDVRFDAQGNYIDFDSTSELISHSGKRTVVTELIHKQPRTAYIGDGLNDLSVRNLVTRFIGYGGAFFRESIAAMCDFYVKTPNFSPILPLVLTRSESESLSKQDRDFYQNGFSFLQDGHVLIR